MTDETHTVDVRLSFAVSQVNELAATMDASKTLWQEGRELYAQCNVEAGVAECNKKLSQ
jgi:exonuclease VII small subunit